MSLEGGLLKKATKTLIGTKKEPTLFHNQASETTVCFLRTVPSAERPVFMTPALADTLYRVCLIQPFSGLIYRGFKKIVPPHRRCVTWLQW